MKLWNVFVPNKRLNVLLERFLISSVTSVVVIRFYLAATDYPQVGGGGLHISHMLWGGLSMLIALVIALSFSGRRVQSTVAVLGGIGFGTFIDELGKFITSDNNYFFPPTLPLIYLIYIILFLSFRILESSLYVSEQEHHSSPTPLEKMVPVTKSMYQHFVDSPHFATIVIIFFISYTLLFTLLTVFGVVNLVTDSAITPVVKIGWFASSSLSYIMILIGILFLQRSRFVAYIWFERSILVSIFLTQVFLLYTQPMVALDELLMNLIVLAILNYLTRTINGAHSIKCSFSPLLANLRITLRKPENS